LKAETVKRSTLVLPVLDEVVDHSGIGQRRNIAEIRKVLLGDLA
jgi:hypothetical protein